MGKKAWFITIIPHFSKHFDQSKLRKFYYYGTIYSKPYWYEMFYQNKIITFVVLIYSTDSILEFLRRTRVKRCGTAHDVQVGRELSLVEI
jgi:hypothetical protein